MEQRRAEQQQKLAAFREKKRLAEEEKKNTRPAWRPGGRGMTSRATSRPTISGVKTRSMTKAVSSPAMLATSQRKEKGNAKLPKPTRNVASSSTGAVAF